MISHGCDRRVWRTTNAPPRVGLFGLLGQGNLGNDASMEAVLTFLRSQHFDVIVDALCTGPEQVTSRYGIPAARLRWFRADQEKSGVAAIIVKSLGKGIDAFKTASWVRRHDLVIVPGMGVLEATTLPQGPWQTPYSIFLLSASGRLFRTKVALVSVGASFTHKRLTRWLLATAARLAEYRSYRDDFSREAMGMMGVDTSADAVYPDLVFALPVPPAAGPSAARTVGVGVMDYSGSNDDRKQGHTLRASYVSNMTHFILWLIDNGRPVRLLSGDSHDERILEQVLVDLRAKRPNLAASAVIVESVATIHDLMRQLAQVETVVATRYHNVLCALKLAIPTVSIGYGDKFNELMTGMGLAGYCQSARSLDVTRLIRQFSELERNAAQIRQAVTERNSAYSRLLDQQFQLLSDMLRPPTTVGAPTQQPGTPSSGDNNE